MFILLVDIFKYIDVGIILVFICVEFVIIVIVLNLLSVFD